MTHGVTMAEVGDSLKLAAGVEVIYYRTLRRVRLLAWYPVGEHDRIQLVHDYSLGDFLEGLDLTTEECREVLKAPKGSPVRGTDGTEGVDKRAGLEG